MEKRKHEIRVRFTRRPYRRKGRGNSEGKEEGIAEGIEIGRSEGLEKGHSEGRYEMAVLITENMMKQGLTPEQTAALTGLTVDEVEALRKRIR